MEEVLPIPSILQEKQTAVLRRVPPRVHDAAGGTGKGKLPDLSAPFCRVDHPRDEAPPAGSDTVEPAPVARPEGQP